MVVDVLILTLILVSILGPLFFYIHLYSETQRAKEDTSRELREAEFLANAYKPLSTNEALDRFMAELREAELKVDELKKLRDEGHQEAVWREWR